MENFLKGLLEILEYADAHDGIVAMLGIAVTVLIFRREVVNNFYTRYLVRLIRKYQRK